MHCWRVYDVVREVCTLPLNNFCPSGENSNLRKVMCLYEEAISSFGTFSFV